MKMRNINYFDKELSVEEYVKKEVCKNAGTQSVAFKEQLISPLFAINTLLNIFNSL